MTQEGYTSETKAAVLAALLTGQRVNAIASEYKIPKQTVSRWNQQAQGLLSQGFGTEKEPIDVAGGLGRYLDRALAAIAIHVEHTTDKSWLNKQDASSLAVLHGVMVDKIIRLLEASEAAREQAEDEAGEDGAG